MGRTLLFDIETDGFLKQMTRITSLVIRDAETRETFVFRNHDGYNRQEHDAVFNFAHAPGHIDETIPDEWVPPEDSIGKGVQMLEGAEHIVGHNIIAFDIKAVKKIYPGWEPQGKIVDTLVMTRLLRPDIKQTDYALQKAGKLPGKLIGKHNLDSWGFRLGLHKGDYVAQMKARNLEPFSTWNQSLEDYCINDVDVTELLWAAINGQDPAPEKAQVLEHQIHDLTGHMEHNGFPFDAAGAQALAKKLQSDRDALIEEVRPTYGSWLVPQKKRYVNIPWEDPKGANLAQYNADMAGRDHLNKKTQKIKARKYFPPRPEFGEDDSRAVWGDVDVWKRDHKPKDYPASPMHFANTPHVKCKWLTFNPQSRQQVIDRFTINHGWTPSEFTDEGNPSVSHEVLEGLKDHIPAAPKIAEILFQSKLIGYLETGAESWARNYDPDTQRIHPATITGGTVSGRCAHASPNIGQVPGVKVEDGYKKDGSINPKIIDPATGKPYSFAYNDDGEVKRKVIMMGRPGRYGFECRSLFYVPETVNGGAWQQCGVDLSGIEFRALAELVSEFDGGELMAVVLSKDSDVHTYNAQKTGLNRDIAKRLLYACVPMDTLALTRRGWKTYDELIVGEPILTYNATKGVKEWKPLLEKVYYPDAPIIEMSTSHAFNVRSTPNHRWFCRRRTGRSERYYVDCVGTTDEITTEHGIIVNAPMAGDNWSFGNPDWLKSPKYGTDWTTRILGMNDAERRAFLTGFVLADGHWRTNRTGDAGQYCWNQNVGDISEAALTASYLCFDAHLHVTEKQGTNHHMVTCLQGRRTNVTGQRLQKRQLPNAPVWCVRTANESWVMRQGNCITITGNTMYGAGDWKLGFTAMPIGARHEQIALGKRLRAQLMEGLPALKRAIDKVKAEAKKGYIIGLDGRKLFSRSEHSVLNLRLQSDAALIAKKWACLTEEYCLEDGMDHSWNGDFAMLAFVHDEVQAGASVEAAPYYARHCVKAARDAGLYFGWKCPVDAQAKFGHNWAECH